MANIFFSNASSLMNNPKLMVTGNSNKLSLEVFGNSLFHGWTISYTEILMLLMIFGLIGWCIYLTIKFHRRDKR